MANLSTILALLGAQGAGELPPLAQQPVPGLTEPMSTLPPAEQGGDIMVTAPPGAPSQQALPEILQQQPPPQAPRDLSVMPMTQASEQMQATQNPLEGLQGHKGMFGLKGTLRDILGTLGDSLLVGSGGEAAYRPQKQQEQISDMAVGFNNANPQIRAQAIQRVMQVNPAMGMKLLEQEQLQAYRQDQTDTAKAKAETAAASKANTARIAKARLVPNLMAQARNNPEQQQAIKQWYMDPESSIDDLDPGILADAAINPYQERVLEQGDARIGETGRHNRVSEGISQQRANRPTAGRQAPNPTAASLAADIMRKPANQRSADEQDLLDNFVGRNKKKSAAQAIIDRIGGGQPKAGQAPAVGFKNKNGLTFKGGDPNNRKNWR